MNGLEEKIRRRAYELWQQSGKTGSEIDYWRQAEREISAEKPAERPQDRVE